MINDNNFFIWDGVFDSFASANKKITGSGFNGVGYFNRVYKAATECINSLENSKSLPLIHKQRNTYLPLVVLIMLQKMKHINILDFGGGLGIGYLTLKEEICKNLENINYSIVEIPEIVEVGKSLYGASVNYHSELPKTGNYNLIFASSSFQYVEDWKGLVRKFQNLSPEYILLSDVFAGDIKSFVTIQNYYESKIPHWFLNLNDLLDTFKESGYELLIKSYTPCKRLNIFDILPMDNFDDNLRIPYTLHLLFKGNK